MALHLKELFDAWGLESFVKVSGSKGLHLSVPLNCDAPYEMTQPFAKAVAELVRATDAAKLVVSEWRKAFAHGQGADRLEPELRLQNHGARFTRCARKSAAPFISLPITWEELTRAVKRKDAKALFFTPAAAVKRIKKIGDLFAPVLTLAAATPGRIHESARSRTAAEAEPLAVEYEEASARDKSLREYTAKRDFTPNAEPAAQVGAEDSETQERIIVS